MKRKMLMSPLPLCDFSMCDAMLLSLFHTTIHQAASVKAINVLAKQSTLNIVQKVIHKKKII